MYAALVEAAGYVPVALEASDYIELLPARWRAINAYGIKIDRRTYDDDALNPLRQQRSGVPGHRGLWEIHHDPYDVSRIYVRGPEGWITVFWRHLDRVPVPFGDLAWDHARRSTREHGQAATEEQIADAVAALLQRAHAGPQAKGSAMSNRDRRVAARTKTTTPPLGPTHPGVTDAAPTDAGPTDAAPADARRISPAPQPDVEPATDMGPADQRPGRQDGGKHPDPGGEQADTGLAKVIPLGIFDPFQEAERRW